MKITGVYPRDIIAFFVLLFSLTLIGFKINSIVSGIVIMIITYYFSRRLNGEGEPEKDINQKVKKLEEESKEFKSTTQKLETYIPKPMLPGEVIVKPSILS